MSLTDAPRGFVPMADYLKLQRRCDELEERLALRKDADRGEASSELVASLQASFCMANKAAQLLAMFLTSRKSLLNSREIADYIDVSSLNCVAVHSWRVNRQLAKYGAPVVIDGVSGIQGRSLTPAGRAWLEGHGYHPASKTRVRPSVRDCGPIQSEPRGRE